MQSTTSTMQQDAFYDELIRPLLFRLDPEDAHNLVHQLLHWFAPFLPSLPYRYEGTELGTQLFGVELSNPIGLAAGFDKNAELVSLLGYLGFGYAEVGSITAQSRAGNPRPRMFRLPDDRALINRLGLNGQGADSVSQRLRHAKPSLPIGINIAKTHDPAIAGDAAVEDILYSFKSIRDQKPVYVALNASCPNTREGCMEEKKLLADVLREMQKLNAGKLPILIKVSPDSSDQLINDIIEVACDNDIDGYVCGNTTVSRNDLQTPAQTVADIGLGGLSGPPLTQLSLQMTKKIALKKEKRQVIIACGGISSGADAYTFIRHGASALQIYTALIYYGPGLVRKMCGQMSKLLTRDGLTLKQAVGVDLKR